MTFHGWVLMAAAGLFLWCFVKGLTDGTDDDVDELLRKWRKE